MEILKSLLFLYLSAGLIILAWYRVKGLDLVVSSNKGLLAKIVACILIALSGPIIYVYVIFLIWIEKARERWYFEKK